MQEHLLILFTFNFLSVLFRDEVPLSPSETVPIFPPSPLCLDFSMNKVEINEIILLENAFQKLIFFFQLLAHKLRHWSFLIVCLLKIKKNWWSEIPLFVLCFHRLNITTLDACFDTWMNYLLFPCEIISWSWNVECVKNKPTAKIVRNKARAFNTCIHVAELFYINQVLTKIIFIGFWQIN
jgi:hypothetical protein